MKIFDNIKNNIKSFLTGGENSSGYLWEGKNVGKTKTEDLYTAQQESYVVFACLDKIQKNTANIELSLYKALRNKKIKEIEDHDLLNLLYKVNPFTTIRQMIGVTQLCIDAIGKAYWYKVRNKRGEIIELWLLRPDLVSYKSNGTEYISYYEYTGRGKTERFETKDVIPFLNPNAKDMRDGQSKLQPAMDLVRSQIFSSRWNMNFFYREARPDAILNVKQRAPLDKDEKQVVRDEWNDNFQGPNRTHKIAIMQGDVEYKIIGENQKDMDFVNLDSSVRNNIMMALGVPKPILLPEEGNKTTVEGAIYIFMSQTIEPNMQNIVDTLNEFLVPDFDITLYLDFESPVPRDKATESTIIGNYVREGIMTRNEAREKLDLAPLDGGDEILVSAMLVPLNSAGSEPDPAADTEKYLKVLRVKDTAVEEEETKRFYKAIRGKSSHFKNEEKRDDMIKNIAKSVIDKIKEGEDKKVKKVALKKYTPELKQVVWNKYNKESAQIEKVFEKMFIKLETDQQKRIVSYLFKEKKDKNYILKKDLAGSVEGYNWKKEVTIFIDVALPLHTKTIVDAGKDAATRIGSAFDVNEDVRAYISSKSMKFAGEVNETTKESLKATLSQGIEEGETLEELKKRVEHTFDVRKGAGARAVAATETSASINGGWLEAFKQSKVIEKKEWYHAGASINDRPEHVAMNGEVVNLDNKFSNGLMFPCDPSASPDETVNCKCIMLEVVE